MRGLEAVGEGMDAQASTDIQLLGANARAQGLTVFDSPFYKPEAMPASTGETIEAWNAKQEAWSLGWTIEDAIRA